MCGIAGVVSPGSPPAEATLTRMNDCLAHRGPDDAGSYRDGPVGLAHRRLSIIDPAGGAQPMDNEDGSVVVAFNGEIYGHRRLREDLEAAGHRFSTDADTEVIVHGYEEHGVEVCEHLDGMFAFALWDADRERLLLARDRMGVKPLVVGRDGDRLAFASELPALFETDLALGGLDRAALGTYFALGFVPSPRTAFANVQKLRPGELAVVDAGAGSLSVDRRRYYRPTVEARTPSLGTAATELRDRVEAAVERRLMSDVPLGAFLSGGVDSSVVVGTMAAVADGPVRTFTVGFDEPRFDESAAARTVADHHDTDHTEYTVTPADVRETVPDVLDRLGEPFADPSLVPTSVVARETARDVTVALSGDGADELFAGYDRYRGEQLSGYYRALPAPVRRATDRLLGRLPVDRTTRLGELGRQARKFRRGGEPDAVERHLGWLRIADRAALAAAAPLEPEAAGRRVVESAHDDARETVPDRDDLARMLAVDARLGLPDQLLHKVDRAGMAASLEVRVPFLDRRVVEYALSLPTAHRITARDRKRVLRRAFADRLPDAVLDRGKQGFDMPVGEWLAGPLADEFHGVLGDVETDLLDVDAVAALHREHSRGRADHAKFLWSVYVFARWHRRLRRRGVLSA